MRLPMLAMVVTIFAGCEIRDDAYINSHQPEIEIGMPEQEVVALAGSSPSRRLEAGTMCKDAGGVRELFFDDVLVLLGKKHVRNTVSFCFNRDGKLVSAQGRQLRCCSDSGDRWWAGRSAESAERMVRTGMSVSEVVDLAAATNHSFSVTGFCGSWALNVRGDGGNAGLVAWRGSPGGDRTSTSAPEGQSHNFQDRSQLREALDGTLLKDSPCSSLLVGFPASRFEGSNQSWRFEVALDANSLVVEVKPPTLSQ